MVVLLWELDDGSRGFHFYKDEIAASLAKIVVDKHDNVLYSQVGKLTA